MPQPSIRQLEKFIHQAAQDSANIAVTTHAQVRMKERSINRSMVTDVLKLGRITLPPEPDSKDQQRLICRIERFVAGINVAVVVSVQYPEPGLIVVTVMDVRKV